MSEHVKPSSHESAPRLEAHEAQSQLERLGKELESSAEKEKQSVDQDQEKHDARKSIDKLAISGKEKAPGNSEKQRQRGHTPRSLKKQTYQATMNRVEAKLPAYQRTFSRIINAEPVDKVSTVAAKTVARPSGILGGGLSAFIGLIAVTYFAQSVGFEVKASTFLILLAAGWLVGLAVEGLYRLGKHLLSLR